MLLLGRGMDWPVNGLIDEWSTVQAEFMTREEFPDGAKDLWVASDPDEPYEVREEQKPWGL